MNNTRLLSVLFPNWLWSLPKGNGRIALTFDDGPHPDTTPALLRALDELKIKATMFLVGMRCEGHHSLIREIESAGHAIANHGYNHSRHALRGRRFQKESIQQTETTILESGVTMQKLFRPPFGSFDFTTGSILKELGYRGVIWSVLVWDWTHQTPEHLWKRTQRRLHDGAIIVLHDGHPTTPTMISMLPYLAEAVHRCEWTFDRLSS
ncbi:polysaccharide deacetylase family protein [bacterium]|nr:polysaccharide deacetylase family protein [bacterium]MBU1636326.1 polysaccharide deacetylase family protein [bacterium]